MPKINHFSTSHPRITPEKSGMLKWLSKHNLFSFHSKVKNSTESPLSNHVIKPQAKRDKDNANFHSSSVFTALNKLDSKTIINEKTSFEKNMLSIMSKVINMEKEHQNNVLSDTSFINDCNDTIKQILNTNTSNAISNDEVNYFISNINWDSLINFREKNDVELFKESIKMYLTGMNRIKNENQNDSISSYLIEKFKKVPLYESEISRKFPLITRENQIAIALNKASGKHPSERTRQEISNNEMNTKLLSTLNSDPNITTIHGINRDVYLDTKNGVGYKIYIPTCKLNQDFINPEHDIRLNDIYASTEFYHGKYKQYAECKLITITDDIYSDNKSGYNGIQFKIFENAQPLAKEDKIPEQWLADLHEIGFGFKDIKPQNFIYVKNNNNSDNKYDLIPIDAKFIGLTTQEELPRSNVNRDNKLNTTSIRTKNLLFNTKDGYDEIDDAPLSHVIKPDLNGGKFIGVNNSVNLPKSTENA